jgi:murein DD-endopeptidase MepM/ murein hydrolase activator NlpD
LNLLLKVLWLRKHTELKIVLVTIFVLMMLPLAAVVVVASSGIAVASAALAALNPITHQVEVYSPTGQIVDSIKLTTVWPTRGYVSDEFGTHDIVRQELNLGPHTGIDIANRSRKFGELVTPFMEGTIINIDNLGLGTCGQYVRIQHIDNIQSLYCHLESTNGRKIGDKVHPGDVIGLMGSTGASTGAHTHFQINVNGIPVNPRTFMVGEPEPSTVQ